MASWGGFERARPELAAEGKRLFYQFGPGLGFLATVQGDSLPRLHPICPVIAAGGLYGFIVPSVKLHDLRNDGRYALHCYPPEDVDDEFCVMGRAVEVRDPDVWNEVAAAYHMPVQDEWSLFAFDIERCLHAKYQHRGDPAPVYSTWIDPSTG